jgi:hypothetical protein
MYTLQARTSFKLQMLYMYCIYVHTHGILSRNIQNLVIISIKFHCEYSTPYKLSSHLHTLQTAITLASNIFFKHCSLIIHTLLEPFIFTTGLNLLFVLGIVITCNRMNNASVKSMKSLHNILTLHVS